MRLYLLLEVGEPLVDDPGDAGVEWVQLLVFGGNGGGGRLRGEYAHQAGEEGVEVADHLMGGRGRGRGRGGEYQLQHGDNPGSYT